jgi:hypothetical protein
MTAWLISLRDRPIAESERRGALTTVLVLLILTALLLVFTRPAASRHLTTRNAPATITAATVARAQVSASSAPSDGAPSPTVARASREFLARYLAYLYGRAPAGAVSHATAGLLGSLRAHPPRVSPAMRGRVAQVLGLRSTPASPPGLIGVRAVINDGGLVDYPIRLLLLEDHGGRLLVSGLEGEG